MYLCIKRCTVEINKQGVVFAEESTDPQSVMATTAIEYTFTDEESALLSQKPRMGAELTVGDKIQEANLLKSQGNVYFKAGNYRKAVKHYNMIFLYVNGVNTAGDSMSSYTHGNTSMLASDVEASSIKQLKIVAYTNMAMCQLKLNAPEKAIDLCDKVLVIEPSHVKALLRKAQAYVYIFMCLSY
jgi:tetratricopeptide (TPR) repeat protein